jgi:hypothetical protein
MASTHPQEVEAARAAQSAAVAAQSAARAAAAAAAGGAGQPADFDSLPSHLAGALLSRAQQPLTQQEHQHQQEQASQQQELQTFDDGELPSITLPMDSTTSADLQQLSTASSMRTML